MMGRLFASFSIKCRRKYWKYNLNDFEFPSNGAAAVGENVPISLFTCVFDENYQTDEYQMKINITDTFETRDCVSSNLDRFSKNISNPHFVFTGRQTSYVISHQPTQYHKLNRYFFLKNGNISKKYNNDGKSLCSYTLHNVCPGSTWPVWRSIRLLRTITKHTARFAANGSNRLSPCSCVLSQFQRLHFTSHCVDERLLHLLTRLG